MKSRLTGAAVLGVALCVGPISPGAQAATHTSPKAATTTVAAVANGGIPAVVDPAADLAAQIPGPDPLWTDSMYIVGQIHGGGHNFGILVSTANLPNAGAHEILFSVSDETTGWYKSYEAPIPANQYSWSGTGLDITMPGLTVTGSAQQIHATATTPWGSLDAQFTPTGPPLYYTGVGVTRLLNDVDNEYAFPNMVTTGTLTAESNTYPVSGASWLDRQWGVQPQTDPSMRWTWMNMTLSNGDQVAVWDILDNTAENAWATVLRPDGSYQVAVVIPVAGGASNPWTSPVTKKTYPTRWLVSIPALNASLTVGVTGASGQEFPDGHYEATASVAGIFGGGLVTGTTFSEMVGSWT